MALLKQNKTAGAGSTISGQDIRHILTTDEKTKENLKSLEGNLQTVKREIGSTADRVAEAISNNSRFRKTVTTSLVKSFIFRKRIAEEILAYILEKEDTKAH